MNRDESIYKWNVEPGSEVKEEWDLRINENEDPIIKTEISVPEE